MEDITTYRAQVNFIGESIKIEIPKDKTSFDELARACNLVVGSCAIMLGIKDYDAWVIFENSLREHKEDYFRRKR